MITLYLIRHGRASWSQKRRPKGKTELTDDGKWQAAADANKTPNDLDFILSSPLTRAKQTAKIIGQKKNLAVDIFESLREIDRPNFIDGARYTDEEHQKYMKERKAAIVNEDLDWNFYGQGESNGDLKSRVINVIRWLKEKYKNKKVAIVSHSNFLAMFLAVLLLGDKSNDKKLLFKNFRQLFLGYGGLAIVIYNDEEEKWSLVYFEKQNRS